jgi:dTDP-4-dehydrorhamnose 3,5-epimerase
MEKEQNGPAVPGLGEVATRDRPTSAGIEDVELRRLTPLADHRGSLLPFLDTRDPLWSEPVVYGYEIMIRPGRIKGWGMHVHQTDRYVVSGCNMRVVLYDGREDSPSYRRIDQFFFTESTPGILMIPPGVWHADQNWGETDAHILNLPTRPYDHEQPDKYRIDPHSDAIPFDWELRDS